MSNLITEISDDRLWKAMRERNNPQLSKPAINEINMGIGRDARKRRLTFSLIISFPLIFRCYIKTNWVITTRQFLDLYVVRVKPLTRHLSNGYAFVRTICGGDIDLSQLGDQRVYYIMSFGFLNDRGVHNRH